MARPLRCLEGEIVRNAPSGFPIFFTRRAQKIVTADPWALLRNLAAGIPTSRESDLAGEFIIQAEDYFEVGANLHLASRPLLYYYSFLNLVKALLLIRGINIPDRAYHGIVDPASNYRRRFRFEGQKIQIEAFAKNHSRIFPTFMSFFGDSRKSGCDFLLVDLLKQIPSVHRTLIGVTGEIENHAPVRFSVMYNRVHGVWIRAYLERDDRDVENTLPQLRRMRRFQRVFTRKESSTESSFHVFETHPIRARTSSVDIAIYRLSKLVMSAAVSSILTNDGYRYYISTTPPRSTLNSLAASLAVFFYLSSITRYRPNVFGKLVSADWDWVIGEFVNTQPLQMLYQLTSVAVGVDVVRPYAIA